MTQFIQLHLLTTYAAANLNRDDTGRPKTLKFGGAERLRVSSQSLKRAFRTSDVFAERLPDALGKRSIGFTQALVEALVARGLTPDVAAERAELVIANDKLGKPRKEARSKTEQLVHLSPEEITLITDMADRLSGPDAPDIKGQTVLSHKPRAADIAMFGRMLADNPGYNVEAAVQVAHAFTTHRVTVEDDYYTAVDDLKAIDIDADKGAGFIGVQQYGAGTFYLYICIDADRLLANLAGDKSLAKNALEALINVAAKISPKGKQNSFASRSMASYILQEMGEDTPRSLAAAFQKPVGGNGENDYFAASAERLIDLRDGFARAYGLNPGHLIMDVSDPESATLQDLVHAAQAVIDRI